MPYQDSLELFMTGIICVTSVINRTVSIMLVKTLENGWITICDARNTVDNSHCCWTIIIFKVLWWKDYRLYFTGLLEQDGRCWRQGYQSKSLYFSFSTNDLNFRIIMFAPGQRTLLTIFTAVMAFTLAHNVQNKWL